MPFVDTPMRLTILDLVATRDDYVMVELSDVIFQCVPTNNLNSQPNIQHIVTTSAKTIAVQLRFQVECKVFVVLALGTK